MLSTPVETLRARATKLSELLEKSSGKLAIELKPGEAFLGSGSLPTQAIQSVVLAVSLEGMAAEELAQRLRTDEACVFARIEKDKVHMDLRTITDAQLTEIAAAFGRIASSTEC